MPQHHARSTACRRSEATVLSPRNAQAFRTVYNLTHALFDRLGAEGWRTVLSALAVLDEVLASPATTMQARARRPSTSLHSFKVCGHWCMKRVISKNASVQCGTRALIPLQLLVFSSRGARQGVGVARDEDACAHCARLRTGLIEPASNETQQTFASWHQPRRNKCWVAFGIAHVCRLHRPASTLLHNAALDLGVGAQLHQPWGAGALFVNSARPASAHVRLSRCTSTYSSCIRLC